MHNDVVVIFLNITNYDIHRIFIDNKSSANILFYDVFFKIDISSYRLDRLDSPLVGFTGTSVLVKDAITLSITVGTEPYQKTLRLTFLVIKVPSTYTAILGCPSLNAF